MKTFSKNALYALVATSLLSACSRPYATYQKMPVEHFASQQPVAPATEVTPAPAAITVSSPASSELAAETTPAPAAVADLKALPKAFDEAIARSDNKLTGSRKVEKRLAHVRSMLTEVSAKVINAPQTLNATKKSALMERMMMKKIDKKMKKATAPDAPKAVNLIVTIGAVVALIGLLLTLLVTPNTAGVVLLLAGVVLLLIGLIV